MKNRLLLVIFLLIIVKFIQAQDNDYYWKLLEVDVQNFTAITDSFNNYIDTYYPDSIPKDKLSNIKDYYRYVSFWKGRLGLVDDTALSYVPYFKAGMFNLIDPYCEASDPADWELIGPSSLNTQYLGLVTEVLSDPETPGYYLLSSDRGGIWKSQTTGNSWVNVTDDKKLPGLTATELIRNPFNNDHIIASTSGGMHTAHYGMGIIESFDNGDTWDIQEGFPYQTCPYVQKVIYDPNDNNLNDGLTLWAITQTTNSGKIYVSYNTGDNWQEVTGPTIPDLTRYHDIEIDDQGTVWVTTSAKYNDFDGGVYKLINGTWYDISGNFENGITYQQASLTKPYGGKIFVKVDDCNLCVNYITRVYKTTNYGANWSFLVEPNKWISNKNQCEIEYSPTSEIIYFGGIYVGLLKDNGSTSITSFTALHYDIRDFDFIGTDINGYENVLVATDGGITLLKVDPDNLNYHPMENLNGNHLPIGNFIGLGVAHSNDEFIVAGAIHCHSFKLINGQWEIFSDGDGGDSEVNWDNQDIFYYQMNQIMYTNSNAIYSNINDWFIGMKYELSSNDPYTIYFGRGKGSYLSAKFLIYDEVSDDLTIRSVPSNVAAVGAIGINQNNTIFFADFEFASEITPNRFNKSIDDGLSWTDMSYSPVYEYINGNWTQTQNLIDVLAWKTIEDILFNPDDPNEMWISIGGVLSENGVPVAEKLRVLHSTDLGLNWFDYSENLSPFPVMSLEYQKGSNKRIFAGTDAGVYYRDESMSQWECFNDGLPICIITDLDYDPCNKVLYASTQGRAIFKTDVPFIDTVYTNLDPNQIYQWDTPKEIANHLVIPTNTTLTISSNVYLSKDVKIIVMPGGKLEIDGGVLTNQCGDIWQGIEVWGNPNATQIPANQGILQVINGGTIENAEVAVRVGSEDYTGKGGGIVYATDANFKNNDVGVWFDPYSYSPSNASYFRYCTFDYDRTITGEADFTFAKLNGVDYVNFEDCDFTNNSSQNHVGIGIESVNSTPVVEGKCTTYQGNDCTAWEYGLFSNLYYAIYATAANATDFADVRHTTFTNNFRSIYLSGMTLPRVTSNWFYLNEMAAEESYGLYLDGSTQYWVEDNTFRKCDECERETGIGIYVNASGALPNEIYLNAFDGVEYAVITLGVNRTQYKSGVGLVIRCNDYNNTLFDETIIYDGINDPPPANEGISKYQGSYSLNAEDMAGNLFFYNNTVSGDYDDINNESNHFYYYYSNIAGSYHVEPLDYTSSTVTKVPRPIIGWTYEGGCPSNLITGGGGGTEESRAAMNEAMSDIANTEAVLTALVDGGDTESLKTDVETSTPPETSEIYTELMAESPNLSETVVETSIEKEEVLPNAMIRDIMVANPHTSTSLQLLAKLDDRTNPMPAWMKAQILSGRSIQSLKTELEGQLASHEMAKYRAMNRLARHFGQQPENPAITDSLIALYQSDNTVSSRYMQAWLYLYRGQYQQGQNVMTTIPANFTLTEDELAEYQNMQWLYTMLKGLFESGNSLNELSESQITQLNAIVADETGVASVYARNILIAIDESEYQEPVILPNSMKSAEAEEAYNEMLNSEKPSKLEIYPNPSKDFVIIGYQFDEETEAMIEIRDVSGRLMKSLPVKGMTDQLTITTRTWKAGVYMLSLVVNDKVIETTKFTLAK